MDIRNPQGQVGGNLLVQFDRRLAALEKRIEAIEKTIVVTPGGAEVQIKAVANLKLVAGAIVEIKGAMIKLNNGARAVAHVGSTTSMGQIVVTGDPTVLV